MFLIKDSITLNCGCVLIDDNQYKTRSHNLLKRDDGWCEIIKPVTFKTGEVLHGFIGEIDRIIEAKIDEVEEFIPPVEISKKTIDIDEVDEIKESPIDYPVHIGAGWYNLPDGTKIKGKKAAEHAMDLINGI